MSEGRFDLAQEEEEGENLLEQERLRQKIIADADSEQNDSGQGSNKLNEGSYSLAQGITPIKEEESNQDPASQLNVDSQVPSQVINAPS